MSLRSLKQQQSEIHRHYDKLSNISIICAGIGGFLLFGVVMCGIPFVLHQRTYTFDACFEIALIIALLLILCACYHIGSMRCKDNKSAMKISYLLDKKGLPLEKKQVSRDEMKIQHIPSEVKINAKKYRRVDRYLQLVRKLKDDKNKTYTDQKYLNKHNHARNILHL